jgi:hypothetical protein
MNTMKNLISIVKVSIRTIFSKNKYLNLSTVFCINFGVNIIFLRNKI